MEAVLRKGRFVDDVYHWNLLCCLDECDKRCWHLNQCWFSPYANKDFTIEDTIGINNAYVNVYQKGEDTPIETINLINIRRYEQE